MKKLFFAALTLVALVAMILFLVKLRSPVDPIFTHRESQDFAVRASAGGKRYAVTDQQRKNRILKLVEHGMRSAESLGSIGWVGLSCDDLQDLMLRVEWVELEFSQSEAISILLFDETKGSFLAEYLVDTLLVTLGEDRGGVYARLAGEDYTTYDFSCISAFGASVRNTSEIRKEVLSGKNQNNF